jgi:protease IV
MDEAVPPPFNPTSTPPPLPPPPPVIAPPPPAPRKRRGWMILSFILLALLALSMLANLGHVLRSFKHLDGSSSREVGPRLDEVVLRDNDASIKIAVVNVDGIITGQTTDNGYSLVDLIKAQLKRAADDKNVKAVILKVDSPGGEVLASDEISQALGDFQDDEKKPVIVSMGSLAASGGYYISAPCRWIVANDLTITGSIGVIMSTWNYRGLMDKVGLQPMVFKSGKYKDMLSGSREPSEIPPEERQMIQNLINQTYEKFKQVVQDGREYAADLNKNDGNVLATNWAEFADGRVLSGKEAYDLGFVDELGNFDAAVARAETIVGITNANLVQYQERHDLADLFRLFGETKVQGVKVDLGVSLPKVQAGRLYYLLPTCL